MRKVLFFYYVLFVFLLLLSGGAGAYAQFSGGNGTQTTPYRISTRQDMEELANRVNGGSYWSRGKWFELTNDITDSIRTIISAGMWPDSSRAFCGNFNGNNHKITLGMYTNVNNPAVFSFCVGANITNLVVDGYVRVSTNNANVRFPASIASLIYRTTIEKCVSFCSVYGINAGGLVGKMCGGAVLKNSISLADVYNTSEQGGGLTADGEGTPAPTITGCLFMGTLKGNGRLGGFNGDLSTDIISDCINAGYIPTGNSMYGSNTPKGVDRCISIGVTETSIQSATCWNDGQMCLGGMGGTNSITSLMVGNNATKVLGITNWVYEDSLYPRLKCFDTMLFTSDIYRKANFVAASPAFLWENDLIDYDTYNNVRSCFKVSNKYGVEWISSNGKVEINNTTGVVKLLSMGWDTITARLMTQYGHYATKVIPINITALNNDCLVDTFTISATVSGEFDCSNSADINKLGRNYIQTFSSGDTCTLTATSLGQCCKFLCWVNSNGDTVSYNNPYTFVVVQDESFKAHFTTQGYDYVLNITQSPIGGGITSGEGNYECDSVVKFTAVANPCYTFTCWTDAITGDTVSYNATDSIRVDKDTNIALVANFKGVGYGFWIRAGEHLEVSPNKKNYPIPIYIKPEEDINNFTIREIKLTIDRNIFYPRKVTPGTCIINHNSDTIILNDIQIGYAPKDVESVLCTLYGTMLLGNVDSSLIHFTESTLNDTCVRTDFIDGSITIEICEDGGERLLENGEKPSITLIQNDLQYAPTVEIFALEKGRHTLSIINLYGSETQLARWENQSHQTHFFHLPSEILPNGVYFLLLRTPNQLISSKIMLVR